MMLKGVLHIENNNHYMGKNVKVENFLVKVQWKFKVVNKDIYGETVRSNCCLL